MDYGLLNQCTSESTVMFKKLESLLKNVWGEIILTCYALLFLLARIPHWIRRWFTGGGGGGGGAGGGSGGANRRKKKKSSWAFWSKATEDEVTNSKKEYGSSSRQLCVAPSLLADPNIGRHKFVKIKVGKLSRINSAKHVVSS